MPWNSLFVTSSKPAPVALTLDLPSNKPQHRGRLQVGQKSQVSRRHGQEHLSALRQAPHTLVPEAGFRIQFRTSQQGRTPIFPAMSMAFTMQGAQQSLFFPTDLTNNSTKELKQQVGLRRDLP